MKDTEILMEMREFLEAAKSDAFKDKAKYIPPKASCEWWKRFKITAYLENGEIWITYRQSRAAAKNAEHLLRKRAFFDAFSLCIVVISINPRAVK